MNFLNVSGVGKKANNEEGFVLNDISFTQQRFRKIAVAGETGSGKSTLLKIIAGLIQPDAGSVYFNDLRVKGPLDQLLPGHPRIAYLSQHYELRNHYRVEELLEMASKLSEEDANGIYDVCRISHLVKRRSNELSGGEKQRIALAQLLTSAPSILLLDEPYSNLDPIHKGILKEVLNDIGAQLEITCMLASHDPQDTLSWADEIIVLKDGMIIQQGAPQELYRQAASEYVAGLFGQYNKVPADRIDDFTAFTGIENKDNKAVLIRPESFAISRKSNGIALPGRITATTFRGCYCELQVRLARTSIFLWTMENGFAVGDTVYVSLRPGSAVALFD